jgi:copper transport protein
MRRRTVVFVLAMAAIWLTAPAANAHTDFESSDPTDGVTLDEPVSQITIVFTGEAQPSGEGFVVLDPSGELRTPDRVTSADNLSWVLHFDEALDGGRVGVRWTVAAPDAHPIEGSFSFTIAAPSPDAPLVPASNALPADPGAPLDEFLESGPTSAPLLDLVGMLARSLSLVGAMVAIGGIVFAALVLRGRDSDIRSVLFWVRRASLLLAIGAGAELVHQLATVNGNWLTIWPLSSFTTVVWSSIGLAIVMRLVGGGMMLRAHLDVMAAEAAPDPVPALQAAVPFGAGPSASRREPGRIDGDVRGDDRAWRVDGDLALVFTGVAVTVAGFAFDGHTVTEGLRPLTSLVAMAHASASAVWAGGVTMLAHVVWRRHRRSRDTRALELAVRFSVVAAMALIVAGGAGTLLAATILDRFSDLWTTAWGRVLLAKLILVSVAAASGAYNHKVLIPRMMRRSPDYQAAEAQFRRSMLVEGAAMGLVIVITAALVAAAS